MGKERGVGVVPSSSCFFPGPLLLHSPPWRRRRRRRRPTLVLLHVVVRHRSGRRKGRRRRRRRPRRCSRVEEKEKLLNAATAVFFRRLFFLSSLPRPLVWCCGSIAESINIRKSPLSSSDRSFLLRPTHFPPYPLLHFFGGREATQRRICKGCLA